MIDGGRGELIYPSHSLSHPTIRQPATMWVVGVRNNGELPCMACVPPFQDRRCCAAKRGGRSDAGRRKGLARGCRQR